MSAKIRFSNGSIHECKVVGQSVKTIIVLFQGSKYAVDRKALVSPA